MLIICQIDWREVGVVFELQCFRNCTLSSFSFFLHVFYHYGEHTDDELPISSKILILNVYHHSLH